MIMDTPLFGKAIHFSRNRISGRKFRVGCCLLEPLFKAPEAIRDGRRQRQRNPLFSLFFATFPCRLPTA
jgi:hypothetical protein